jgi:hypothetical protein
MGADITGITTNEKLADQYAWKNVLALPLVGSRSDVSASIACTSTTTTYTVNANVSASNNESNFYNGSFYFDGGATTYLSSSTSETLGAGDWTLEFWYKHTRSADTSSSNGVFLSGNGTDIIVSIDTWGSASFIEPLYTGTAQSGSFSSKYTGTSKLAPHVWNHIAITRTSGDYNTFINGILSTYSSRTNDTVDYNLWRSIGARPGRGAAITGYLQDIRTYKGLVKYTSDFVVPSRSPDILPDTPSGVAGGSKLTKITDGAVSFDASGDNLTLVSDTDLSFGTGDFTIEAYAYLKGYSNGPYLFDFRDSGSDTGTTNRVVMYVDSSAGTLRFWLNGSARITDSQVRVNSWNHYALVRSGSTTTLYVNGISQGTYSDSTNYSGAPVVIGQRQGTASQSWDGFISNVRIVKGTALYTSRFTPPIAPLTNVTNTKLLCCQDITEFKNGAQPILNTNATGITTTSGTRVDPYASSLVFALPLNGSNGGTTFTDLHATIKGSGSAKSVEVTGNTQTSTTQSQYYGSSGYFDGAGNDYLTLLDSSDFAFGSGDFTIEAWVYPQGSGVREISAQCNSSGGGASFGHFLEVLGDGRVNGGGFNPGDNYINVTTASPDVLSNDRWYHVAMVRDGNSLILYIDGTKRATTSVTGKSFTDSSNSYAIGRAGELNNYYWQGYIQDYRVYKGAAKYTSNFNVTAPSVEPTAAVSPSSIVAASAAATNFNPSNTDINTVRGQETGYCTLNPLNKGSNGGTPTNGNLKYVTGGGRPNAMTGTVSVTSGKWYYETVPLNNAYGSGNPVYHPAWLDLDKGASVRDTSPLRRTSGSGLYGWSCRDGYKSIDGVNTVFSSGCSIGDVVGLALDLDNGKLEIYVNGISQGSFSVTTGGRFTPCLESDTTSSGQEADVNFGQKPFKFAPPDGFQPVTTANARPVKVISRPDQYVGIVTYTGTNASNHAIDVGLKPDLVWIKSRAASRNHRLTDTVRGAGKEIYSDITNAEGTVTDGVTSFNDNGFVLGANNNYNYTEAYVAWCWKAGGNKNTFNVDGVGYASAAAAGLDGGTLTPSGASVGTKQGFSIIKWLGVNNASPSTISHGLTNQIPKFVIVKNLTDSEDWAVYHASLGNTKYLQLNQLTAAQTSSQYWNDTSPTSTLITLNNHEDVQRINRNYVLYAWSDVPGLQKFGIYTGNNNSDGPYVELGFRPAIVWIKGADFAANWFVFDNQREFDYNPTDEWFNLDSSNSANAGGGIGGGTAVPIDFLSNGFKVRFGTAGYINNTSSYNFVYCAWAEAPTVDLYGGGANAR